MGHYHVCAFVDYYSAFYCPYSKLARAQTVKIPAADLPTLDDLFLYYDRC